MRSGDKFIEFTRTRNEDAGFTTRTLHLLRKSGCKTIGEIIAKGLKSILETRGVGYETVCEINAYFEKHGYKLPGFSKLQQMTQEWGRFDKYKALRRLA